MEKEPNKTCQFLPVFRLHRQASTVIIAAWSMQRSQQQTNQVGLLSQRDSKETCSTALNFTEYLSAGIR